MDDDISNVFSYSLTASPKSSYSDLLENLDDYMRAIPDDNPAGRIEGDVGHNDLEDVQTSYAILGKRKVSEIDNPHWDASRRNKAARTATGPTPASSTTRNISALASNSIIQNAAVVDASSSTIPQSNDCTLDAGSTGSIHPVIVAYSHTLRGYVGKLPYGAQWEIARFVSSGFEYEKFTVDALISLYKFKTNAQAAPEVAKLVAEEISMKSANYEDLQEDAFASAFAKERSMTLPWEELDKEETILRQAPHGGLGCNETEPYLMDDPWYGGRVNFTAKVTVLPSSNLQDDAAERFALRLDRPVLSSSNQFARRFGSRRFIRVRIPKEIYTRTDKKSREEEVLRYFQRPFVVNGFVFRAFFAKEQNVFLFQTDEVWDNARIVDPKPSSKRSHCRGLSFVNFINFHNNLMQNKEQTMVKWAARFALGLSNSVPGARLHPSNIAFEDDLICNAYSGLGKVPNEQIMTDGCGFIRSDLMQQISDRMAWPVVPVAIQMRVCGSKGLLLAHPNSHQLKDEKPSVWLRPSQVKIKHAIGHSVPESIDPAMLTVDVLRPSSLSSPAKLSTETIINLAENGVPANTFVMLMKESMKKKIDGLTTWEGNYGIYRLWMNVARSGGVVSNRLAREAGGTARARGFVFEDLTSDTRADDEDGFDQLDKMLEDHSTAWWDDPISGCPSPLEETVLVMLDSGFIPDTCPVLAAKLKDVVKRAINIYVKRYRIDVAESCAAYIVPDPLDVLEAGEVHIKSSRRNLIGQDGKLTDIVLGDVLVTRHPCKVPTDVQKVKAVFSQKLSSYVDVIVVSTKNHISGSKLLNQHLASCTGGGDYDGDTMEAFWHPGLVEAFTNADPRFLREPRQVRNCLVKKTETVAGFLARNPMSTSKDVMILELQKYLLGTLRDVSMVGMYSTWWENAIYKYGYRHTTTVFLAYMFCAVLDGSKTGVTVSQSTFESHRKQHSHRPPVWKETEEEREQYIRMRLSTNEGNLLRDTKRLGVFVMDEIHRQVKRESDEQLKRVEEILNGKAVQLDEQLTAPWKEAKARAEKFQQRQDSAMDIELQAIQDHVERVYWKWRTSRTSEEDRSASGSSKPVSKVKPGFTGLPIERRQDKLREISKEFHRAHDGDLLYFSESDLRRVRASYAYLFDYNTSRDDWSRFPWDVAMRTLCEIKAGASGMSKTITEEFYARMSINKAFLHETC